MLFTLKNVWISLLLLIAMGLTLWSFVMDNNSPKNTTHVNNQPDTIMKDITAIVMNKEGTPSLKLTTPQLIHYAETDGADITAPRLIVYKKSPLPWYVSADFAKTTEGILQILFWSNVVIQHQGDDKNPSTQINTPTLTVFPKQNIAKTSDAIVIVQPDATVHATGMLANLEDGTVKLLSAARGEYAPTS